MESSESVALSFAIWSVALSLVLAGMQLYYWIRQKRWNRRLEAFLKKVCDEMGYDYDSIDRVQLAQLVHIIDYGIRLSSDPRAAAEDHPIAKLIYDEFHGGKA